ncbi:hypothetical protein D1AOALGA4SA_2991 [Olavius algarvensis Delta 1 endosymbiont]|nr:hypothetical protein D1AOALGA4SA_2991 [Olavius algarvensis Delta 1 endosymbiont]
MQRADDGYELETEIKLIISKIQYSNLVKFISVDGNVLPVNHQTICVSGYKQKKRFYRDFDTRTHGLMGQHASLTARDRGIDYAVTSKFLSQQSNSRHEYTASVETAYGQFDIVNFLSLDIEPVEKAREVIHGEEIVKVLRRNVLTNRANLYADKRCIAELAVDNVIVQHSKEAGSLEFFELEIESKSGECDLSSISLAIQGIFGQPLKGSTFIFFF